MTLAIIGFGEAGRFFVSGLKASHISAYDIKTKGPGGGTMRDAYQSHGVNGQDDMACALMGASEILSLVTADQALNVARAAAESGEITDALYIDGNSCAPDTKRAAAEVVEAAGGRYVDMAIMAPVAGPFSKLPLLIAGPHVEAARSTLKTMGLKASIAGADIGRASTIKMLRSVVIKGLEALMLESLLAAEKAGVADDVITSLDTSFPGHDWRGRATYSFERVTTHGQRRCEEMREVVTTLKDLALPSGMSEAVTEWQETVGGFGLPAGDADFTGRAAAILAALEQGER